MMRPEDWAPIGVGPLESAAETAVRARGNTLVVAGPGAGKTELLGQRAAYLLQTGGCSAPRRILAISFKRDAAANLRERVERRCGPSVARRLDSMTFDAFAKQLLDRFWRALPSTFSIRGPYRVAPTMTRQGFSELQLSAADGIATPGHPSNWAAALINKQPDAGKIHASTLDDFFKGVQGLCLEPLAVPTYGAFLQLVHLRTTLSFDPPALSFPMIGRLAEAMVATNPQIRAAICATYSHVFLDEFQDTTSVQYALTSAIFRGSTCTLTAVGDHKQRIMVWAGARKDAFQAFGEDFLGAIGAAGRLVLTRNYRSNARIVEVLNVLKERLAPEEPDFVALRPTPDLPSEQICAVLEASDLASEAGAVASIVGEALSKGTPARLVGILVRQKAADWEDKLQFAFDAQGIGFRNEDRDVGGAAIQDLMTEAYSQSMVDMLDLLTRRHGGTLWTTMVGHLATMWGMTIDDDEEAERALATELDKFHRANRIDPAAVPTPDGIRRIIARIEAFLGLDNLRSAAPQYATGDLFERVRRATSAFLVECHAEIRNWRTLIVCFRGQDQVPLLTITKSKGLEYHLVILLGLNDDQWWSFSKDPEEGHSNFFVAASRARERLLMTVCGYQSRTKIAEIFDLLSRAQVPVISA